VPQAAESRGRRDHQRGAKHEDHQLHDVEHVDHARGAEAVDHPVLHDRLQALEEGLLPPLVEVERWRLRLDEAHQLPPPLTAGRCSTVVSECGRSRIGSRREPTGMRVVWIETRCGCATVLKARKLGPTSLWTIADLIALPSTRIDPCIVCARALLTTIR